LKLGTAMSGITVSAIFLFNMVMNAASPSATLGTSRRTSTLK